jgi:hypothetical protein
MSQSSEFCRHSPLRCFSMSNTKGKRIFRYRLSPATFGYTLLMLNKKMWKCVQGRVHILSKYILWVLQNWCSFIADTSFLLMRTRGSYPGVTDHLAKPNAEVKNSRRYTSTPQYVFMSLCLIMQKMHLHNVVLSQAQGQLYLTLTLSTSRSKLFAWSKASIHFW